MPNPEPTIFTSEDTIEEMKDAVVQEGKTYMESKELTSMADEIIRERELYLGPAIVRYLMVYPYISKSVAGKCKSMTGENRFFAKCHYTIMVSGDLWDYIERSERKILLWHELLHIDPVYDDKKQEWKMKTREHDFEDFWEIYREKGIQWHEDISNKARQLYEMSSLKLPRAKV